MVDHVPSTRLDFQRLHEKYDTVHKAKCLSPREKYWYFSTEIGRSILSAEHFRFRSAIPNREVQTRIYLFIFISWGGRGSFPRSSQQRIPKMVGYPSLYGTDRPARWGLRARALTLLCF